MPKQVASGVQAEGKAEQLQIVVMIARVKTRACYEDI